MNHQPRQRQILLIRLLTAVAMFSMSVGLTSPRALNAAPLRADECGWQWAHPLPTGHHLSDVWGSGRDDVYAVGAQGTIIHYDGSQWTAIDHGRTTAHLRGIWGSSSEDIYVVGDSGTILHFDGASWETVDHGLTEGTLQDVWGSRGDNVYVVGGDSGYFTEYLPILHFDGES